MESMTDVRESAGLERDDVRCFNIPAAALILSELIPGRPPDHMKTVSTSIFVLDYLRIQFHPRVEVVQVVPWVEVARPGQLVRVEVWELITISYSKLGSFSPVMTYPLVWNWTRTRYSWVFEDFLAWKH
jgi:hypothetical protein